MSLLIVLTTVSTQADARRLAEMALSRKLAACIHIDAIESLYTWQGAVCNEQEWRLWFKTDAKHCPALQAALAELHPYEIPAIYVIEANDVAASFANWLRAALI